MKLRRTMLFMPGNNPGMLQRAGVFGADSVIFDLEDAVNPAEKDAARVLVRNALQTFRYEMLETVVRINSFSGGACGEADVDEIARAKPAAIMLPKAAEQDVKILAGLLDQIEKEEGLSGGSIKIFPLVETAHGLVHIGAIISSSPRITGILLGAEDLTADLGIKRTKAGEEIFYARCQVATACKAAGIDAIDTPFADANDPEGLRNDTLKAKSLGMTGKAAINPRQIDTIHEVLAPDEAEIKYAQRVIRAMQEAAKEGKGVVALDGKMIDAPILARARNTWEKAKQAGIRGGPNEEYSR